MKPRPPAPAARRPARGMVALATLAALVPAGLLAPVGSAMAQVTAAQARGDVTYAGTLPCDGCRGRQVVLTLFGDHTFRMRTRRLDARPGTAAQVDDLGRWGSEGTLRVMRGGRDGPWLFQVDDDGALRPLDARGEPLDATAEGRLLRQPAVDRLPGPMRLRGLYATQADAATLTECRTGKRWPLRDDGELAALERASQAQAQRRPPGTPVLAALSASFERVEPEAGQPPREVLRVHRFERLWPGETCAADAPAQAALLNTRWRIVEVDGQPVMPGPGRREAFVLFAGEGQRVRGHAGCNSFAGRFEQGADGLRILDLEAQRAACPAAEDDQALALLRALRATAARQIDGDALSLRDAQGKVRLRAEALYLR